MPMNSFSTLLMLCKKHAWMAATSEYTQHPSTPIPTPCLPRWLTRTQSSLLRWVCRALFRPQLLTLHCLFLKWLALFSNGWNFKRCAYYNNLDLITDVRTWILVLTWFNFWVSSSLCRSKLTTSPFLCQRFLSWSLDFKICICSLCLSHSGHLPVSAVSSLKSKCGLKRKMEKQLDNKS